MDNEIWANLRVAIMLLFRWQPAKTRKNILSIALRPEAAHWSGIDLPVRRRSNKLASAEWSPAGKMPVVSTNISTNLPRRFSGNSGFFVGFVHGSTNPLVRDLVHLSHFALLALRWKVERSLRRKAIRVAEVWISLSVLCGHLMILPAHFPPSNFWKQYFP